MLSKENIRYEVPLLLAFLLSGIAGLLLPRQASAGALLTMPHALLLTWLAVSTAAGGLGLAGIVTSRLRRQHLLLALVLLRFGLSLAGLQLTILGVAVTGVFSLRGLFTSAILLAFAWPTWSRVLAISKQIRKFRKTILEGVHELGSHPPVRWSPRRPLHTDHPALADPPSSSGDEETQR